MALLDVVIGKEEQHVLNNAFYYLHISLTNKAIQNGGFFFLNKLTNIIFIVSLESKHQLFTNSSIIEKFSPIINFSFSIKNFK